MTYSGLQGATDFVSTTTPPTPGTVLFAHIHVGQRNVAGGVVVFFCGGGNTPATQVKCPGPTSGTVSGTWTKDDLKAALSQGIDPSDPNGENAFARFIHAIRTGISYANVHTSRSPGGEIRGQFVDVRDDDADEDH